MRVRKSSIAPVIAVAAVLVLALMLLVSRSFEALMMLAVVAVLTGMYLLRRYARAKLIYRHGVEPSTPISDGRRTP
jgi:hypothetical protein